MNILKKLPTKINLVPLKDTVVFPEAILSLYIVDEKSKNIIKEVYEQNKFLFISAFKEQDQTNSVYKVGCAVLVMRTKEMPDGKLKVLIQGLQRGTIKKFDDKSSQVEVSYFEQPEYNKEQEKKYGKKVEEIKSLLRELSQVKESLSREFLLVIGSIKNPSQICDLIACNLDLKTREMQEKLEAFNLDERLDLVKKTILNEMKLSQLQSRINSLIKKEIPKPLPQKEGNYAQVSQSKKEDVQEFAEKIEKKNFPEHVKEEALKQLSRLEKMHAESSESSMVRNYLDWLLDIPWTEKSEDNLDVKNAQKILDDEHYGLEKSKERILEFLAVRSLKSKKLKGPIICFVGPPGVGKTSLGQSIATAMGRKYHRVSLGGIKDEGEIRGHRRTYVGSMPGKIIQALKACGTTNPVIVLDEIDKMGSDQRGDPSAALLEVLDPEQNQTFKDHYLNLNYDLSNVLFIATANAIQNISPALKDRLEIITVSGYTQEEKSEIAKRYLINKETEANGLDKDHIKFTDDAIKLLISSYTQEAGVRNLKREVGSICRKVAKAYVLGDKKARTISDKDISDILGPAYFSSEELLDDNKVGIATGLAWTEVGGQILYVEAIKIKNKKGGLKLTGQLGDVMKESAQASLSFVKSYIEDFVSPEWFEENEIHVHLPAGAIPKDGPSAGVTLACSLLSLIANIPIRKDIAMTGEISLSGRVLPVGGIKEKVLAAYNKGITNIVLPKQNKKDIKDIKKEQRDKINFIFISSLEELFKVVFAPKRKGSIKNLVAQNQKFENAA